MIRSPRLAWLLLAGFGLVAADASAKCPTQRIVLDGTVRDAPAGNLQVLITARFPKQSDLNLLVDVEDGAFSATVPFDTYKGRGLLSVDNCSRKPKSLRMVLFHNNREAGSTDLDFPRDFVEGHGVYRPREALVLCCSERAAGRLARELPLPDEIVLAIVDAELPEFVRREMRPLCLIVNYRDPSTEIRDRLLRLHPALNLMPAGSCFQKRRGFNLELETFSSSSDAVEVGTKAVDPRLENGVHFFILLWETRYSFRRDPSGDWTLASKSQTCCEEPAAPASLADSPEPIAMTLSVLVVDKGWLPIPGVKVGAAQVPSCDAQASSSKPMTVTTNEKGWAEFPVEGPGTYLISIKGEGGFRSTQKCVKLYAVPTQPRAYVQMQLHAELEVPLHDPKEETPEEHLEGCSGPDTMTPALAALARARWQELSSRELAEIWPLPLAQSDCQSENGCLMVSTQGRVIEGECECCATFDFHIQRRPDGSAQERLQGVVILHSARRYEDMLAAGRKLARALGVAEPDIETIGNDSRDSFTWQDSANQVLHVAEVEIWRRDRNWTFYLAYGRHSLAE